eukprot:gene9034-16156_t
MVAAVANSHNPDTYTNTNTDTNTPSSPAESDTTVVKLSNASAAHQPADEYLYLHSLPCTSRGGGECAGHSHPPCPEKEKPNLALAGAAHAAHTITAVAVGTKTNAGIQSEAKVATVRVTAGSTPLLVRPAPPKVKSVTTTSRMLGLLRPLGPPPCQQPQRTKGESKPRSVPATAPASLVSAYSSSAAGLSNLGVKPFIKKNNKKGENKVEYEPGASALLHRLTAWRQVRCRQIKQTPNNLLPDHTIRSLVERQPQNLWVLQQVPCMGRSKVLSQAHELLDIIRDCQHCPTSSLGYAPATTTTGAAAASIPAPTGPVDCQHSPNSSVGYAPGTTTTAATAAPATAPTGLVDCQHSPNSSVVYAPANTTTGAAAAPTPAPAGLVDCKPPPLPTASAPASPLAKHELQPMASGGVSETSSLSVCPDPLHPKVHTTAQPTSSPLHSPLHHHASAQPPSSPQSDRSNLCSVLHPLVSNTMEFSTSVAPSQTVRAQSLEPSSTTVLPPLPGERPASMAPSQTVHPQSLEQSSTTVLPPLPGEIEGRPASMAPSQTVHAHASSDGQTSASLQIPGPPSGSPPGPCMLSCYSHTWESSDGVIARTMGQPALCSQHTDSAEVVARTVGQPALCSQPKDSAEVACEPVWLGDVGLSGLEQQQQQQQSQQQKSKQTWQGMEEPAPQDQQPQLQGGNASPVCCWSCDPTPHEWREQGEEGPEDLECKGRQHVLGACCKKRNASPVCSWSCDPTPHEWREQGEEGPEDLERKGGLPPLEGIEGLGELEFEGSMPPLQKSFICNAQSGGQQQPQGVRSMDVSPAVSETTSSPDTFDVSSFLLAPDTFDVSSFFPEARSSGAAASGQVPTRTPASSANVSRPAPPTSLRPVVADFDVSAFFTKATPPADDALAKPFSAEPEAAERVADEKLPPQPTAPAKGKAKAGRGGSKPGASAASTGEASPVSKIGKEGSGKAGQPATGVKSFRAKRGEWTAEERLRASVRAKLRWQERRKQQGLLDEQGNPIPRKRKRVRRSSSNRIDYEKIKRTWTHAFLGDAGSTCPSMKASLDKLLSSLISTDPHEDRIRSGAELARACPPDLERCNSQQLSSFMVEAGAAPPPAETQPLPGSQGAPPSSQLLAMAKASLAAWEVRRVLACNHVGRAATRARHLAALRIEQSTDADTVGAAFRKLSLLIHPDKHASNQQSARDAFQMLTQKEAQSPGGRTFGCNASD